MPQNTKYTFWFIMPPSIRIWIGQKIDSAQLDAGALY